ncbi:MAG: S8 family serine peptidase [Actinomycetota bacterium]|nr:S8 family serine peptidase [Actinomycetota bacterium]
MAQATARHRRGLKRGAALALAVLAVLVVPVRPASSAPAGRSAQPPAAVPGELIVGYREGSAPEQRAGARQRAGATLEERVVAQGPGKGEVERVRLPSGKDRDAAISELRSDPSVAYAEPNWLYTRTATSNDPYYTNGSLWGMYGDATTPSNQFGSQAGEAWGRDLTSNTGSRTVVVGIIDEGIQVAHTDLDANVWVNPFDPVNGVDDDGNGYTDDKHGWDFVNKDNSVYDGGKKGTQDKHGTHVAGTVGAEGGNSTGVAGVNWDVTFISAKFLGRQGGTLANAVKAVDYLTDLKARHGLDIVATNNSWGGGGFSQALLDAITRAARANILFIAAAGNSDSDNDTTASYPSNYDTTAGAGYDAVVAVAAIDSAGELASFSNYGATTVDLGAPGVSVYSTLPVNKYGAYSGTSMATPHVSGGAALYAASHPLERGAPLKTALLTTTVPTASLSGKVATGGRLDVSGY